MKKEGAIDPSCAFKFQLALEEAESGDHEGIVCRCGEDHEEGLSVQCDQCARWEHASCCGLESISPGFVHVCGHCNKTQACESKSRSLTVPSTLAPKCKCLSNVESQRCLSCALGCLQLHSKSTP